jgi:hypothetical protein
MRDEVVLIVDTNSNYSDVWDPCFVRLDKYASKIKKYVFTDTEKDVPKNYTPIIYDNSASYRNQLLSCLKQIKEKYIIYTSEDYILYDFVQLDKIEEISKFLDETDYSFCKFIKGPEKTYNLDNNLFMIDKDDPNFFAQQASIWKTRDFQKVFETAPPENTRMQHEPGGSKICQQLGFTGLQYFSNTNKRGLHHYDSEIYPCVATAVVKGLWNISEYPVEVSDIMSEFKIDPSKRGWR